MIKSSMLFSAKKCMVDFTQQFELLPNKMVGSTTQAAMQGTMSSGVAGGLSMVTKFMPGYMMAFLSGFLQAREIFQFISYLKLQHGKIFTVLNGFASFNKKLFYMATQKTANEYQFKLQMEQVDEIQLFNFEEIIFVFTFLGSLSWIIITQIYYRHKAKRMSDQEGIRKQTVDLLVQTFHSYATFIIVKDFPTLSLVF